MTLNINRRNLISLTAALTAATATGLWSSASFAAPSAPKKSIDQAKLLAAGEATDMIEGDANAPVTMIEYASLTCGHCAHFYSDTLPQIREKYIKTGKVRLIFREFAYDPRATAGFMLARCAPKDRYFPLIQVLFEKQMEWAAPADALTPLKQIAKLAGFDDASFEACLKNQSVLDTINTSFQKGQEFGVEATPTFFINGDMYEGALTVDEMSQIIDKHL